ncbi:MAG: hypothetical protein LC623_04665 [Halobacteriales archaeon]|nr:hypothetical protein [Halobacteriales archaeon]
MPNRVRPRCPTCDTAMGPAFCKGPRGKAFIKIPDTFHCLQHNLLARGRQKPEFL